MVCWSIYLILNRINGKKYIGQTVQGVGRRWTKHTYNAKKGSTSALGRALRKYGPESFEVLEIARCSSKADADISEKTCIVQHRSNQPEFGYNLTEGGDGISGWHHTEETKREISISSKKRATSEYMRQLAIKRWNATSLDCSR